MATQKENRPTLIIDLGNALVKYRINDIEHFFPHALAMINEDQYRSGLRRTAGKPAAFNFVQIGKTYYAIGESASAFPLERRQGRPKYEEAYYGPFLCAIMARHFASESRSLVSGIDVMASHAPLDAAFADDLIKALKGVWDFSCGGVSFKLNVVSVTTYDEPFGGYNYMALVPPSKKGGKEWAYPLYGYMVGMIDLGGGTISATKIDPTGAILRAHNTYMGINDFMLGFEPLLIKAHKDYLGLVRNLPESTLRDALRTGKLKVKGDQTGVECNTQIKEAGIGLINALSGLYIEVLGSGTDIDIIGLTGGGMGSFYEQVKHVIRHSDIRLAAVREDIHFANIRGAANLLSLLKAESV